MTYEIVLKNTRLHERRAYAFGSKKEMQSFLEQLTAFEIERIEELNKYCIRNGKTVCRSAFYDFFD